MSCAQVMYQPYAPSPYVVQQQAETPHGAATPNSDIRHDSTALHHHQSPGTSSAGIPHLHPQAANGGEGSNNHQRSAAGGPEGGVSCGPFRSPSAGSAGVSDDVDGPPPEKKLCRESDTPASTTTPTHSHQHHQQHHLHHPQHHQHHLHHHHHQHQNSVEPTSSSSHQTNEVKYVSANCMVVTHYQGDTASVVEEHFSRALAASHFDKAHPAASSPMASRNFPPSFWNSNYQVPPSPSTTRPPSLAGHLSGPTGPSDIYDAYHSGLHSLQHPATTDPWAYSLSSQAYGHRSVAHDVYQAAMSSVPSSARPYHQYSSLSFQPHLARLPSMAAVSSQVPVGKPDTWGARYHETFGGAELAHGLDSGYSTSPYANVPGLETAVPQDGAKDLYWF